MIIFLSISFILFSGFGQLSFGDDQELRLDAPGMSMHHVVVLDQYGQDICFSCATASAIDAWRFSHGDTNFAHATSPRKLALDSALVPQKKACFQSNVYIEDLEISYEQLSWLNPTKEASETQSKEKPVDQAPSSAESSRDSTKTFIVPVANNSARSILAYNKFGSCSLQDEFKLSNSYSPDLAMKVIASYIRSLMDISQTSEDFAALSDPTSSVCLTIGDGLMVRRVCTDASVGYDQEIGNSISRHGVQLPATVLQSAVSNDSEYKALQKVYDATCRQKPPHDKLEYERLDCFDPKKCAENVMKHFDKTPASLIQPLRFGFCSNFLTDDIGYRGIVKKTKYWLKDQLTVTYQVDCKHHASLIIGKRIRNGRREVLIQNSLGLSCDLYLPTWKKNCKDGKVWVDLEQLVLNTSDVSFLEKI